MTGPFQAARLRALREEQERRRLAAAAAATSVRPFDPLADSNIEGQRRFFLDRSEYRSVSTTRRAGKSSGFARDMLAESSINPRSTVYYLNTTGLRARGTIWEELKDVVRRHGLPYLANEGRMTLVGPENRWIKVGGGETKKHIDRVRGTLPALAAAYVDEAQDWDEGLLEYAIAAVLMPTLADRGGRLCVGGTPSALPEGLWHSIAHSADWSKHGTETGWTMWTNPWVKNARKLVEDACKLRGVDETDATIQREFFGRWVRDTQALVFGALDDELNAYDALPDGDWSFVGGADGGYVDSAALAVLGWPRLRAPGTEPRMYLTRSEMKARTGAYDTIAWLQEVFGLGGPLGARLLGVAADPAAGMKNIAEDLWTRHGLQIDVADKQDKVGGLRLMAGAIATRELLLPRGHAIFRSLRRVQWDPDHRGERLKGHTPDDVDAALYGFRKAWPLFRSDVPAPPLSPQEERIRRLLALQNARVGD